MNEEVLNKSYSLFFYIESVKLFLEGLDKYIKYLKQWDTPGNEKIQEKISSAEYLREFVQDHLEGDSRHVSFLIGGRPLSLIKSTLPYLLNGFLLEREELLKKNPPPEATEAIDRRIERIKELMVTGVMKDLPTEDIMGKIEKNKDSKQVDRPYPLLLDNKLQDMVRKISKNGKSNDRSINDASTELEDRIRTVASLPTSDFGQRLIDKAFRSGDGIIVLSEDANEQDAYWKLFDGFLGAFKNSTSHRRIEDISAERATQIIQFADYLISLLQEAKIMEKKDEK